MRGTASGRGKGRGKSSRPDGRPFTRSQQRAAGALGEDLASSQETLLSPSGPTGVVVTDPTVTAAARTTQGIGMPIQIDDSAPQSPSGSTARRLSTRADASHLLDITEFEDANENLVLNRSPVRNVRDLSVHYNAPMFEDVGSDRGVDIMGRGTRGSTWSSSDGMGFRGFRDGGETTDGALRRPAELVENPLPVPGVEGRLGRRSASSGTDVSGLTFADLRRDLAFIRQEMFRVPDQQWQVARDEFHVRLADLEAQMQEGAYSHIDALVAAGLTSRARHAQSTADKLHSALVGLQELANDGLSPRAQAGRGAPVVSEVPSRGAVRHGGLESLRDQNVGRPMDAGLRRSGETDRQRGVTTMIRSHRPADSNVSALGNRRKDGLEGRLEQVRTEAVYHPPQPSTGGNDQGRTRDISTACNVDRSRRQGWGGRLESPKRFATGRAEVFGIGPQASSRERQAARVSGQPDGYLDFIRHSHGIDPTDCYRPEQVIRTSQEGSSFRAPGRNGGPPIRGYASSDHDAYLRRDGHDRWSQFVSRPQNSMYHEGESFYLDLPSPWHVLPVSSHVSQSDYMKMMFNHSFSGKLEEYETFRALFIPIKHSVDVR